MNGPAKKGTVDRMEKDRKEFVKRDVYVHLKTRSVIGENDFADEKKIGLQSFILVIVFFFLLFLFSYTTAILIVYTRGVMKTYNHIIQTS